MNATLNIVKQDNVTVHKEKPRQQVAWAFLLLIGEVVQKRSVMRQVHFIVSGHAPPPCGSVPRSYIHSLKGMIC